jgi:drug/metabolite transporter (DMT)-like permease
MIGATSVFAMSSATSKWLVDIYPVGEVLFTRSGLSLIACALFILPQTGLAVFHTSRRRDHVMRTLSQTFSQTCLIIAFSLMPLASAVAINFSSPLFTTLVAILLLKEIVTNPGAETFQIGALFALANAMIYGSVTAAVRGMTATESAETLLMYQLSLITLFFSLMLPFGFTIPSWWDAGLMLLNGITNAIGQYWWTRALHLAPASAVTPFFYLSLLWAALLGYLVWGDLPTLGLMLGSAVVVGSGLFLLWRESLRR